MGNPSRAKGDRFEYRVRDDLTERGYFCMRAPASRSPIDILAVGLGDALFVQCKTNGRLDPAPWNELYELALSHGGTPILASKPTRGGLSYHRLIGTKVEGGRTGWAPLEEWTA
jgi:Holliday junction resolvase